MFNLPVWLLPAVLACVSIGFISGMSGILPKPMTPPLFLFIVGATWTIYFIFIITKNVNGTFDKNIIIAATLFAWATLMFCVTASTQISLDLLVITVALGLIAALGNHALFTAIKVATEINQTGFPLAVFGSQSIFAFVTVMLFAAGGNYVVQWTGFSGIRQGVAGTNIYHWIAFALCIGGAMLFCLAENLGKTKTF